MRNSNSCSLRYIGETSRNLKTHIYEHKKALLHNNLSNPLVVHRNNFNLNLYLNDAVLSKVKTKTKSY